LLGAKRVAAGRYRGQHLAGATEGGVSVGSEILDIGRGPTCRDLRLREVKAFDQIRTSAFYAAISGPLALGLGLFIILTEKKTTGYDHITARIKVGWSVIAIAGAIMIVGAPVFVGYSIWRYTTL
jgi:hypothetical protein